MKMDDITHGQMEIDLARLKEMTSNGITKWAVWDINKLIWLYEKALEGK